MADSTFDQVLKAGEKVVANSGTAEAIDSGWSFYGLSINAKAGNAGQVYIGGADVTTSTNDGYAAGEGERFLFRSPTDIAGVFIDADNNGEGVDFTATLRQ